MNQLPYQNDPSENPFLVSDAPDPTRPEDTAPPAGEGQQPVPEQVEVPEVVEAG